MSLAFDSDRVAGQMILATNDVLETMFFSSIDREWRTRQAGMEANAGRPRLLAEISFSGGCDGCFRVSLEQEVAESLASSFLGSSEVAANGEEGLSTMAEMANMICGSLLSRLDNSAIFRLSSPSVRSEAPADRLPGSFLPEQTVERFLGVERGLLHLALAMASEGSS